MLLGAGHGRVSPLAVTMRCWRRSFSLWSRTSGLRPPTNRPEEAPSISRAQSSSNGRAPRPASDVKPGLRALDLARKVQQEKAKPHAEEPGMSPQQRRVAELRRVSMQLQYVHPNVLAKHLHRSVLYQDQRVVIINKPYGVPVRDDTGVTSVASVLPVVSKLMDGVKPKSVSQLFPCLHLEKEVTGTLLLARNEEIVKQMLNLSRDKDIQMKYWVITVGVPVPSEGLIDIPIIEREVTGSQPHHKMALSPLYKMNEAGDSVTRVRSHRQAHPALTKYKVLGSSCGCGFVELEPLTAVKHQMRVHMAYALGCPILGDHKYSHWSKLAPQRLPERVLGKLGLEQAKTRHLPLHVHARQLMLHSSSQPQISVSAPLPRYFTQTLKQLLFELPEKTKN